MIVTLTQAPDVHFDVTFELVTDEDMVVDGGSFGAMTN